MDIDLCKRCGGSGEITQLRDTTSGAFDWVKCDSCVGTGFKNPAPKKDAAE